MTVINTIKPAEAFHYLHENSLPLFLSFHLEEDRGHLITGRGLCYVEALHSGSRVKLGRFSPYRSLHALRSSESFYVHFEIQGNSYGCVMENITPDNSFIVADIPGVLYPFLRKFMRVEPSKKTPVLLHVISQQHGTVIYPIKDISERGLGFFTATPPDIGDSLVCGIEMPLDGGTFILSNAVVVYSKDDYRQAQPGTQSRLQAGQQGIFCGMQLFPHHEDEKRIRLYVMQRELEIRKRIQEQF